MYNLKWIFIVILLLLSNSAANDSFSSERLSFHVENEVGSQVSEDLQELSPSRISASVDYSQKRIPSFFPHSTPSAENSEKISRENAYFSFTHLIEPGLSPPDIIFPFHTFL